MNVRLSKTCLLLLLVTLLVNISYAQVPANDDSCNAVILTPATSAEFCNPATSGTNVGATISVSKNCYDEQTIDVWYKFTATQAYHKIVLRNSLVMSGLNIQLFQSANGLCGSLSSLGCISNNASGDSVVYKAYNLTIGATYYVKVFTPTYVVDRGTFEICVTSPAIPAPGSGPGNDECSNAVILSPSSDANNNPVSGSCVNATPSVRDCYDRQSDDVWYKFQATSANHKIIVKGSGFVTNTGLFEYYPDGCNTLPTHGQCITSYAGDSLVYKMAKLVPGTWYYVKVATNAIDDADRVFTISITTPQVPVNDECAQAVLLPTYATWHPTAGTMVEASGYFYEYDCNSSTTNDVWYKFVATATSHRVVVEGSSFVQDGGNIQFFTGTCNNLQLVDCAVYKNDPDSTFYLAGNLTVGETYYFKIYTPLYKVLEYTFNVSVLGGTDPDEGCTFTVPTSANQTISAATGNICDHDHNITPEYNNNVDGYTVIQPAISGDWVKLTFTLFNTEQDHDYVTIYNGEGITGNVLYTGSGLPSPLPSITAQGALTIRFQSDGSGTAPGFKATISNIKNPCDNAPSTLYVDSSRIASGNGSSWSEAYKTLSEALYRANLCPNINEVHVSKGTYYPTSADGTPTTSRDSSFRILRNGIKIYGGFPSDGNRDFASPSFNPTILSGDIGLLNDKTDNAHHVIVVEADYQVINNSTVADGFTIMDGSANIAGGFFNDLEKSNGAGMCIWSKVFECSPLVNRCLFSANDAISAGGAMLISSSGIFNESSPTIRNCTFENNTANDGGAISVAVPSGKSKSSIMDCVFKTNSATDKGGAINIQGETGEYSGTVSNCTFSQNTSGNNGGAVQIDLSFHTYPAQQWINCVFTKNTAVNNGGGISLKNTFNAGKIKFLNSTFNGNKTGGSSNNIIQFESSTSEPAVITNCVFGNDLVNIATSYFTISYSLINQPVFSGNNNIISGAPVYVNEADADGADNVFNTKDDGLIITRSSQAFDKGDNSAVAIGDAVDILHKERIYGPAVDMGAFEVYDDPDYSGVCPTPAHHIMYVDQSIAFSGDGSSWSQAKKTLSEALFIASQCTNVDSILIAQGTYHPVNYDGSFSNNRYNFFRIFRNNLKLYGGYPAGGGTRDVAAFPTLLSGDFTNDDNGFVNNEENCYHIMVIYPAPLAENAITPENTVIDGFTFSGGNPDRPFGDGVTNVIEGREIAFVVGGAIYNKSLYSNQIVNYAESSPLINNCTFINNSGRNGGGAIYSTSGVGITSPLITNSTFRKNRGADGAAGGGAILIDAISSLHENILKLKNCLFEENNAGATGQDNQALGGAVLAIFGANVLADNTVFSSNTAGQGAAVLAQQLGSKIPVFNNCLFTGNIASVSGSVYNGVSGNFNNCTFNNNTSTTAINEIFGNPGTNLEANKDINITNSIFSGDIIYQDPNEPSVTTKYHLKNTFINQAAFNIVGNHNMIMSDPHFLNPNPANVKGPDNKFGTSDDGLSLSNISPAVNSGDVAGLGAGFPDRDIKNDLRVFNDGVIDLGCYELQEAMNSDYVLSGTYALVNRNVGNDPVVVIENDQLVAKLVNVNTSNDPFLNQYKFAQVVHPNVPGATQHYLSNSFHIGQENGNQALPAGNSLHVTVYFTQAMFNDYNANNGIDDDMPTGTADVAGISHIRIYQYHGTENAGCDLQNILPSCYNSPAEEIIPELVTWNSGQQRWEVTFAISTFSGFYISGRQNEVLPLQLVRFNADKRGQAVQLSWSTMNELNTSHFELERSKNGLQFQHITQVKAAGNFNITKDYTYTDQLPEKGFNYYRLKQVDKDGKFVYSPVRLVNFSDLIITVYPNPIKRGQSLQINLQNVSANKIELLNTVGQVTYLKTSKLTGVITVPVSRSLAAGEYVLRITTDNTSTVKKVVIQ